MTTATAEQTETKNEQSSSQEDMEKVVTFVANDFLRNATINDLFSGVQVNTLIQLLQNQSINRAKEVVKGLSQEEFNSLLDSANNPPQASEESSSEQ